MTNLDRLRALCLALPEAEERETWEVPTFRIRNKIFAMAHDVDGRPSVWMKAPRGVQALLTEAAPDRFFRPPYVGHKGWIGLWLDAPWDQEETAALVARSWRMTAPKRLAGPEPSGMDAPAGAGHSAAMGNAIGNRRKRC